MTDLRATWTEGIDRELRYWRTFLRARGQEFVKPFSLKPWVERLVDGRKAMRILDAGAGPVSVISSLHPTAAVSLTACDALAHEYTRLRAECGVRAFVPVEHQDLAGLTYGDGAFDLVYCSNTLDHCCDPRAAIREMVRVCAPGGLVHLRHITNVAERENYSGLHQWNVDLDGADARFWRPRDVFSLTEIAPFVTYLKPTNVDGQRKVMVVSELRP